MVWTHFGHTVSLKPGSLICWIYIQYFHNFTHLYKYRYCHKSRQTWVFVLCHTDSASKSRPWTYAALPLTQKSKVWLLFWLLKATVSNAKRFGKRFTTLFTTFSEYLPNYTVMFFFFKTIYSVREQEANQGEAACPPDNNRVFPGAQSMDELSGIFCWNIMTIVLVKNQHKHQHVIVKWNHDHWTCT